MIRVYPSPVLPHVREPAGLDHDKPTLAEEAYAVLTEEIICLDLAPGTVISEWSLSKRLSFGRTPIREAVKQLVRDRLVSLIPHRGIMVSHLSITDMLLMLEPRRALEPIRYSRAARRSSAEDRTQFLVLAEQLERAAAALDIRAHTRIDKVFDDLVDLCAANPFLAEAEMPLHNNVRRFWNTQTKSGGFSEVARLHAGVVRAVATGEPERATEACNAMLDFNERFFRSMRE